jgi:hypothetical protein
MQMLHRLPLQVLAGFLAAAQAVAAPPVDVYILTGQSNSLGTTAGETNYTPGTHPADAIIRFFWANVSGSASYPPASYGTSGNLFKPLQMQQGGVGSPYFWGAEFGFARTLYDAGRTNFVIIKASASSGGNTLWDKAAFDANHNNGPMWGHVSNTVYTTLGKLVASNQSFSVRGLLYIQGEGNTTAEAPIAGSRFSLLFSNLMAAINFTYPGTATDMRAVIGEIAASQSNPNSQITTTQQVAVAYSNNAIAFVGTRDQPLKSDNLHFPKSSKLEIGARMANCFLGRPTIVSVGFDAVTNASDGKSLVFERYVPDTNGVADGVNLNGSGPFTGFGDGANGQPRAGLLVIGSAGRVVFADYYNTSVTSDIACGLNDFAGKGLPANWADCGTAVSFAFADPVNQAASALVSAAAFELVSPATSNNVAVSLFDGHGDSLYTSGVITNRRFGFEAREAFSEVLTSAVARITLQGATNVLWTVGHITDGGVPDFAWNGWRLPSGYERWSFQIADPTQRGDTTDADGDGGPNLLEYATATSPTNKLSVARLTGVWTNGSFAVRFPRANADDITWRVERAWDLSGNASWDTIAMKQGAQPWSGPAVVEETDNGSGKLVLVYDPDSSATQHYLRLRVSYRAPSGYELWSLQISDAELRGDAADPDGDSALNLIEYATGTEPTNKLSVARLEGVWTNGVFAVRFPRATADDITWRVERAGDLSGNASWDTIATKQGSQPWSGPAVVEEMDNGSQKLVLVHDPDPSAKQRYLRLQVTRP